VDETGKLSGATTLWVKNDGNDSKNGLSEILSFQTMQRALDASVSLGLRKITVVGTLTAPAETYPATAAGIGAVDMAATYTIDSSAEYTFTTKAEENSAIMGMNNRRLFNIKGGGTVIFQGQGTGTLTLQGAPWSTTTQNGAGVYLSGGSTVRFGDKSVLYSQKTSANGGGIYVMSGSKAEINAGAEIYGNTAAKGGGIYVSGTVDMKGGKIRDNTATDGNRGDGVYQAGTFKLWGTPKIDGSDHVYLAQGSFITLDSTFSTTAADPVYVHTQVPPGIGTANALQVIQGGSTADVYTFFKPSYGETEEAFAGSAMANSGKWVITGGVSIIRQSGTWKVPAGVTSITVTGVGGGGAGGRAVWGQYSPFVGWGGKGSYRTTLSGVNVSPGSALTVTIGTGGVNPTAVGMSTGGSGGATSLKTGSTLLFNAPGGAGGVGEAAIYIVDDRGEMADWNPPHRDGDDGYALSTEFTTLLTAGGYSDLAAGKYGAEGGAGKFTAVMGESGAVSLGGDTGGGDGMVHLFQSEVYPNAPSGTFYGAGGGGLATVYTNRFAGSGSPGILFIKY
jgi:hypothetical protein